MKKMILVLLFIIIISLNVLGLSYCLLYILGEILGVSISNLPSLIVDVVFFASLILSVYLSLKIWIFIIKKYSLLDKKEMSSMLGPFAKNFSNWRFRDIFVELRDVGNCQCVVKKAMT